MPVMPVVAGIVGETEVPTVPIVEGTLIVGLGIAGLTPRLPIWMDPNGTPVRGSPPGAVGDVEIGVDDEARLPEPEPHIPDNPDVSSIPEVVDIPDVAEIPDDMSSRDRHSRRRRSRHRRSRRRLRSGRRGSDHHSAAVIGGGRSIDSQGRSPHGRTARAATWHGDCARYAGRSWTDSWGCHFG